MRGSGKTSLGKTLAKKLNRAFVDLDQEIEKHENASIVKIVSDKGWPYFRKIEQEICAEYKNKENLIISCGGGVVLDQDNIENLKKNGQIILIKCPIEICARRIQGSQNRPSLTEQDFIDELNQVWIERQKLYEAAADLIIEDDGNKSIEELIKGI